MLSRRSCYIAVVLGIASPGRNMKKRGGGLPPPSKYRQKESPILKSDKKASSILVYTDVFGDPDNGFVVPGKRYWAYWVLGNVTSLLSQIKVIFQ